MKDLHLLGSESEKQKKIVGVLFIQVKPFIMYSVTGLRSVQIVPCSLPPELTLNFIHLLIRESEKQKKIVGVCFL